MNKNHNKNNGENVPKKRPPSKPIKSVQYDLFSWLLGDESKLSNTIELWDSIPKYFFTTQQVEELRTPEGLAQSFSYEYILKNAKGEVLPYKVRVQPALIEQADGKDKAFFPTRVEETIEEVLRKVFTDQQFGIHNSEKLESWVKFSYSMIRRELYRMGSRLRYDQIKHSLEVMSKCVLTVHEDGKEIYTGTILQDYCSIDRDKYMDDTEAHHVARLPVFISHAVNNLQYRQYNYIRFMECKEHLTRFLYKRLINHFTYANSTNSYHFMYSDVKQASGLLQQSRETDNRKKLIRALDELKKKGVLRDYNVDGRKEGRSIIDVKYTVIASYDFISEQKAANKRNRDIYDKSTLGINHITVDK